MIYQSSVKVIKYRDKLLLGNMCNTCQRAGHMSEVGEIHKAIVLLESQYLYCITKWRN